MNTRFQHKRVLPLILVAVFGFSIGAANFAWAQPGMGSGGGQGRGYVAGDPYSRMYNPKTVETLGGEVVSVDQIRPREENVLWGAFHPEDRQRGDPGPPGAQLVYGKTGCGLGLRG